jgi:hypothetical protein
LSFLNPTKIDKIFFLKPTYYTFKHIYYLSSFLKNGIKKTKQAIKKNILPNIDQKLPMLAMQKPMAEMIKRIHPSRFIYLFFILIF